MSLKKRQLLVILGPTATGKTDLALSLAKKFSGELVSCDSRQVYKGLDIGTGKLPSNSTYGVRRMGPRRSIWEIGGIRVWMYDVLGLKKQYTVANYVRDANKVIAAIIRRDKLPIIVGGTGFYLKALLEGLPNLTVPMDLKLRKDLQKLSLGQLQNKLQILSAESWEKMNNSDQHNPRRVIRAIELGLTKPLKKFKIDDLGFKNFDILKTGLTASRSVLYQRADQGVVDRIGQGMIEEVKKLHGDGLTFQRMKQLGLEYRILADYLEGVIGNKKDLIKMMQQKIHGYIRDQLTWFKKEKDIVWFNITDKNFKAQVEKVVEQWYHHPQ